MVDLRSVIDRSLTRVDPQFYTLESFYRRRDRKQRNKRITAGAVGIAIVVAGILAGIVIIRSDEGQPAHRIKPTPILRDGEVLQVEDEDGPTSRVVATDLETGDQRVLHRCDGPCGYIAEFALSTDGGWVAWEESCGGGCVSRYPGGVWVAGADGSEIHVTPSAQPPPSPSGGWIWAWSTATEQIAFVAGQPGLAELVLFDPATDARTSLTTVEGISALSWSPDGTAIAIASPSGVSIIDLATGRSTSIARIGTIDDHGLSWSPDGTRLLLETQGRIIVVNADGSDRRVVVNADATGAPAWSPDSTRIAYLRQNPGSGRRVSLEAWVIGADGTDATRLFHGACCIGGWSGPVWSPDGSRIAFFDDIDVPFGSLLAVNADGTGSPEQVDDVVVDGWIQG